MKYLVFISLFITTLFSYNHTPFIDENLSTQEMDELYPYFLVGKDYFGSSLSISGDTTFVGAHVGNEKGEVHIFTRQSDGTYTHQQELTIADGDTNDSFGFTLSADEDLVAIGSHGENSDTGLVYIYHLEGGVWSQEAVLSADDGEVDDRFGVSVSLSGSRVLIGANGDDDNGSESGAAYTFTRDGGGIWTQSLNSMLG